MAPLLVPISGATQTLSEKITGARAEIEDKRAREGVLTTEIEGYNTRIDSLEGQISALQAREAEIQERLDAKEAELARVRAELERTRERLAELRAELAKSLDALANRLVELYKADEPDALTVVLDADGFGDLLERTELLERVSAQDQRIVVRVRELKEEVEAEVRRLEDLEGRVQAAVEEIAARRNELAAARERRQAAESQLQGARNQRRDSLAEVSDSRADLEDHLRGLEAEQARVQAQLAGAAPGQGVSPGPIKQGSGSLIWPVNGSISSPFGMRWGRLHAGIDIAAPSGTPIRAADSGRVAIAGPTGGYGNYVCIQHGGSLSTCYGHMSSIGTSVGANVGQGDVIGNVGCTGSCTGDHLHFETRVNGSPVDPMGYL